jgi:hypothetical protein
MEIISKINKYYLFSHTEETPIYYFIHSKITLSAKYGGKKFVSNVSFKINKKNFNLKRTSFKFLFNKKTKDYEYVFYYSNRIMYGKNCSSLTEAFDHIINFFQEHEEQIEEYI